MPKHKQIRFSLPSGALFLAAAVAFIFPLLNAVVIYPSFSALLMQTAEDEAARVATHLESDLFDNVTDTRERIAETNFVHEIKSLEDHFHLLKLRIFARSGEAIYSTDVSDIGMTNSGPAFAKVLSTGIPYSKLVKKHSRTAEGLLVSLDVIETYIPITRSGTTVGVLEVYHDVSRRRLMLRHLFFRSSLLTFLAGLLFLVVPLTIGLVLPSRSETQSEAID